MSPYFQTYYSTGEFAKLCHTTKETLFHYDAIGLLKPKIVKDNGYRYYLSVQYFDYDLIKVLQQTHMSLKEIKEFMESKNNQQFITLLQEKYQQLEVEKKHIEDMQYRITRTMAMMEYNMKRKQGIAFVEECQKEHILIVPLLSSKMTDQDMIEYMSQHLQYCATHHLKKELPLGTIVYKEQLLQNCFHENMYYMHLDKKISDKRYRCKPKGRYATILHKGFYDTIEESFQKLLHFIREHQYPILSDAYEYELINHFSAFHEDQYVISISILIEEG